MNTYDVEELKDLLIEHDDGVLKSGSHITVYNYTETYTWHIHQQEKWLEVPLLHIYAVGINPSKYEKVCGENLFMQSDLAEAFLNELPRHRVLAQFKKKKYKDRFPINLYPNYKAPPERQADILAAVNREFDVMNKATGEA
jgi:hypothetical protein